MGCDKPENLPDPTSLQAFDDLALSIRQSGAADFNNSVIQGGFSSGANVTPFPFVSVPVAQPLPRNVNEMNNSQMDNLRKLNALLHHQLEANLINARSVTPNSTPSEMPYSTGNVAEMNHSSMNNNMPTSGSFLNEGVMPMKIENPGLSMNFMPMRTNTAGYPSLEKAGKATGIRQNSLQASGSPFDVGHGIQHSKNLAAIGIHNDAKANPAQFSSPGNIDGSFLTLGLGSNIEDRSNFRFGDGSRLEDAVLPLSNNSNVQRMRRNFSVQGVPSGTTNFHHDSGGLPNPAWSLGLSTCSSNNNETMFAPGSRTTATPFLHLNSQPDMRLNSSNSGNSGSVGKADVRHFEPDPFKYPQGGLPPPPLPFSSNSTLTPHLGYAKMAAAPESAQPIRLAPQPSIKQQQNRYTNISRNQSFMESPSLSRGGGTVKPDHLGQQPFVNVPHPWENNLFDERMRSQIARSRAVQSAADNQFPKRLGVQLNGGAVSQATQEGIVPGRGSVRHIRKGDSYQARHNGPAMHSTAPLHPPLAMGQPHGGSTAQFNVSGVPYNTAQGVPIPAVDVTPQASYVQGHASLKRRATGAPPIASTSQRRRILTQHGNQRMAHQRQSYNAPVPVSSPSLLSPHVKRQAGLEESAQPIGEKCLLCKRDVSFNPEGPVSRPAVPPAVAVLPCGHVFHDHCLQIITPQEQSGNPPCIPCALGET